MQITEKEYGEIANDLMRVCNTVAIPRFIKALRNAVELGMFEKFESLKGITPSLSDFRQEFVDWISYGNLDTNFESKVLGTYSATRKLKDWEEGLTRNGNGRAVREISDEDIPF